MPIPYPHPLIAREGWPYLIGLTVIALVVTVLAGFAWSIPLWILDGFVLQFFRDPPRVAPLGENNILSPADGRIVSVMTTTDPYLNREALKISVFMNVFNVHSNRSPVTGSIQLIQYHPGSFVNADLDKASESNERNAIVLKTQKGQELTCVQVAGLIARRILCYTEKGKILSAGERYGFIRFGSRVDVFLPVDVRVCVAIGDVVKATETVLAEWNH
ncbi:MAG: phosphatidylserine decarboxylase [Ferrovum sp.]|jgi:phosphatidylserine decarboxylase|nr:phosphatidylserine decarboxylase [Ferrovum sp.]